MKKGFTPLEILNNGVKSESQTFFGKYYEKNKYKIWKDF